MIDLTPIRKYIKLNTQIAEYYSENLKKNKHILEKHVLSRIPENIVDEFKLGLSCKNSLIPYLQTNNLCLEKAEDLSVLAKNKDDLYFEFFNNRIVIPIISSGIIVGFAGRKLYENQTPKYLNSKTSFLYNKRCILYGLWQAFDSIIRERAAILVEGYFDVLTLHAYGIKTAIAPCGTSLSDYQAKILTTIADRVYILYDGDVAGNTEAKKVKNKLKNAKVVTLPDGYDPDDYIKLVGVEKFKSFLGD